MKLVTYTGSEDETETSDAFQIEVDDEIYEFPRDVLSGSVPDNVAKACQDYDGHGFEVKAAPKDADPQDPVGGEG